MSEPQKQTGSYGEGSPGTKLGGGAGVQVWGRGGDDERVERKGRGGGEDVG